MIQTSASPSLRMLRTEEDMISAVKEYGASWDALREHCIISPELVQQLVSYREHRFKMIPKIANYRPNEPQMAAHNSWAGIVLKTGGNQSGKTYSSVMELCIHLLREYPEWWKGRRFFGEQIRIRVCATSREQGLDDVIIPLFKELLPEGFVVQWHKNKASQITGAITFYGDYIQFMSYDQDTDKFRSSKFNICYEDECPPRDIHEENVMRTSMTGGYVIIAATVLWKHMWLWDELMGEDMGDKVFHVCLPTRLNPGMTDELYNKIDAKMLTPEDRLSRLEGKPIHLAGVAFKEFGNVHIVSWFQTTDPEFSHYMVADPHGRQPWHLAWWAVNPKGRKYVCDEAKGLELITYRTIALTIALREGVVGQQEYEHMLGWDDEAVQKVLCERFHRGDGKTIWARLMDTSGWELDSSTRRPKAEMLGDYGIIFTQANKTVDSAVTQLHQWLMPVPEPEMFIMDNCPEHIYQFKNTVHDEWRSGIARDSNDPKEGIRKKRRCFIDTSQYMANFDPQYMMPRPRMRSDRYGSERKTVNSVAGF